MTANDTTVIFLHMAKAGGMSLHPILDWNYDHPHSILRYEQIPPLLALPDAEKRRIDCLKGQVFYGIHQYFPQPCTYFTILRHPVDRVVSQYYYNFERKRRLGEPLPDWTIEDFLQVAPFHAAYQLRLVVGGSDIDAILNDPLPEDALEIARRNLDQHFCVVGVTDYYDETLMLLKRALGWSRIYYARQNVTRSRQPLSAIPPQTLAAVERACAPEIALYEHVKQQVEALLAQQGDDFRRELEALRRANRRFERLYNLARPVQQTVVWNWSKRLLRAVTRRNAVTRRK